MELNKFGWPKKKIKVHNPKIIYAATVYFMSKLFWRKIYLCVDLLKFKILTKWYIDKYLEDFTLKIFLKFKFFRVSSSLFFKFLKLHIKFSDKKHIYLLDSDIILFGPYINNHTHKIIDYLLRLIFLKKLKIKRIFVPAEIKSLVEASCINFYLRETRFFYYNSNTNYIFNNVNYLSHIDTRFHSSIYKNCVQKYKYFFDSINYVKNNNYKYILISRGLSKRKLLNEEELYKSLMKFGFLKIHFENLSFKKQIEISRNAKIMIGYHGAGLSNCFFMKKNMNLIELVNKYYNHPFYGVYSKILELNYKKLMCLKNFKNYNAICDIDEIINYVKKIINKPVDVSK
jgi:hypothetical protein